MDIVFIAAVAALATSAALAVWRAWAEVQARVEAEELARKEAAARAEAEELARKEAAARAEAEELARKEAAARAEAEELARKEAAARAEAEELARKEAADRARAQARAKKEIEAREAAEERARAEAQARRQAERRAARLGDDLAEERVDIVKRVDERTLVDALHKALPTLDPERARRIENQLETLARLRADAVQLRKGLDATSDEEVRVQLRKKLQKVEHDAAALVERLRNVLAHDPDLQAVRLSLAWGSRVSVAPNKKPNKNKEDKK